MTRQIHIYLSQQGGATRVVKRHRLLEGHIEDPPLVLFSGVLALYVRLFRTFFTKFHGNL